MNPWWVWLNVAWMGAVAALSAVAGFVTDTTIRGALMLSSDDLQWVSIAYIMMLSNVLPLGI